VLKAINNFIISCSQSWWKFLLLLAGQSITMWKLLDITAKFPAVTAGDIPFDMQNNLTAEQIFSQLAGYSDAAFSLYTTFQIVDYVFPVVAGLLLATICAFSLRIASPRLYQTASDKNLFVLLLTPPVFDYLENINLLWVIASWPEQSQLAAQLAVLAKMGKLGTLNIAFLTTGILLLWCIFAWLAGRLRDR
jgi:hypothetical protein